MASRTVDIYGKESCPYTTSARTDYARRGYEVRYFDVRKDAAAMTRFLELSGGDRRVPLITEAGRVTVGFDGT
jgi:glutaredoxin 3